MGDSERPSTYLNEQSLKLLDRSGSHNKLDFNAFIKQMVVEEHLDTHGPSASQVASNLSIDIFKKKPYLNIDLLQGSEHLLRNKVSDKFTRRDVQFYDLYVKKENGEELCRLKEA